MPLWISVYKFLCGHTSSVLLGKQPTVELLSHGNFMFNCFRNCQTIFQSNPPAMYEGSNFPYCVWFGFNLYFPSDQWCWASFMCLLANVVSSLGKCLFRSFVHILIMLFVFKLLSFHRYMCVCMHTYSLYILDANLLSDI